MPQPSPTRVTRMYMKRAEVPPMPKRKMLRLVNKVLDKAPTKGIHRDQYWKPVKAVWKALENAGLDFHITKSDYEHEVVNGERVPVRKVWKFEVPFTNDRGRSDVVYGQVVAAGAGSVGDPLDAYDVTAYAS